MTTTGPDHGHARTRAYAPLAWTRALAFGLVSGGIGVLGHDLTSGNRTSPLVLLLAIAFATLIARPLAPLRIGVRTMTFGLLTLQGVIHVTCLALVSGGGAAGAAHAQHLHHSGGHHLSLMFAMLALHLSLTALGAFLLLELEDHAWRVVRAVVRAIFGDARAERRSIVPLEFDLAADSQTYRLHGRVAGARLVRGPPRALAPST